jgi:uncharacterized membrane protein
MSQSHLAAERLKLERLLLFTDAVFAIIMTLLALEIRLPEGVPLHTQEQVLQALGQLIPAVMAYVISFSVIGLLWHAHLKRYRYVQFASGGVLFGSLVQLLLVGLIPVTTALLSRSVQPAVVITYAAIILLNIIVSSLTWNSAVRDPALADPELTPAIRRRENQRSLIAGGVFAASMVIACFSPVWAMVSWALQIPLNRLIRSR